MRLCIDNSTYHRTTPTKKIFDNPNIRQPQQAEFQNPGAKTNADTKRPK